MKRSDAIKDLLILVLIISVFVLFYVLIDVSYFRFGLYLAVVIYAADKMTDWLREWNE